MRSAFSLAVSAVLLFSFLLTSFVPAYALKPAGLEESEEGKKQIAKALLASDPGVSHAPQLSPLRAGLEEMVDTALSRWPSLAVSHHPHETPQTYHRSTIALPAAGEFKEPGMISVVVNNVSVPGRAPYQVQVVRHPRPGANDGINPTAVIAQQGAGGEDQIGPTVVQLLQKPEVIQAFGEMAELAGPADLSSRSRAGLEESGTWDRANSDRWTVLRGQGAGRALLEWIAAQDPQRPIALRPTAGSGPVYTQLVTLFLTGLTNADFLVAITPDGQIGVIQQPQAGSENRAFFERLASRADSVLTPSHRESVSPAVLVYSIGGTKADADVVTSKGLIGPADQRPPPLIWQDWRNSGRPETVSPLNWSAQGLVRKGREALTARQVHPSRLKEIGVSIAGPGEYDKGVAGNEKLQKDGLHPPVNVGLVLQDEWQAQTGRRLPVRLVHDGAAAALGEANLEDGALFGQPHGISLIFGTGIGAGILQGRKPVYFVSGVQTAFLGEFGNHLVLVRQDTYEYRGRGAAADNPFPQKPTQGQWTFEQHVAGPWLAARAIQEVIRADETLNEVELFGQEVPLEEDEMVDQSPTRRLQVKNAELQRRVLVAITDLARAGNQKALDFIKDTGKQFGLAIRTFREALAGQPFLDGPIVIGSTLGVTFGAGLPGDPFIAAARKAAGVDNIVRSNLDGSVREFAAFMPQAGLEEGVADVLRDINGLREIFRVNPAGPPLRSPRAIFLDASEDPRVAGVAQALSLMMLKKRRPALLNFRLILDNDAATNLVREMSFINPIAAQDILPSRIVRYGGPGGLSVDEARARALSELAQEAAFATVREMEQANALLIVNRNNMTLGLLEVLQKFFLEVRFDFTPQAYERLRALLGAA